MFPEGEIALAVLKAKPLKMGQIVNISKGGLAFRYIDSEIEAGKSSKLDIVFAQNGFHLKKIPFKTVTDYKALNITHLIKGIDHQKSEYTKMLQADAILGFKSLTYIPGCMGKHKLARDEEYKSHLLVTEEIKQAFSEANIAGVRLVRPEDYY